MIPPKPASRAGRVPLWRYARAFRKDILSAQPERLYRAWMADFRTPFFRSVLVNQPELVDEVLKGRPQDFPKSDRVTHGLKPLLGKAVFVTNGETWARQRRLIDPAFAGGKVEDTFPSMLAAARALSMRLDVGTVDVEPLTSHATADVIFRTLFSIPIEDEMAADVYEAFRGYQRTQPVLSAAALVPMLRHIPAWRGRARAKRIRQLIARLVEGRRSAIASGQAPDDLATRILMACDPETGAGFSDPEMIDQVAIFFLAGHETSAAALAWALYLLAMHPGVQDRVAGEARRFAADPTLRTLRNLTLTRNVFRETLRLYPPVPMMVRQTTRKECFRDRELGRGTQVVLSPWHLHRQTRLWPDPDAFDPARWERDETREIAKAAYMPFSAGPRICPGAGFATIEAQVMLAVLLAAWKVSLSDGPPPVPVAHLTVRSADGIHINLSRR
ncbi:cytochrome P450 [Ovoidimarina sediminis]|uniref:cytochrome P450 n=1 Tax=Ovoidimarina sediminis TaxID=3079856 RepID=UPI0029085BB4|nr:cytochrome P450 [Rhodophyticola sp. MJ-SS7]MDU8944860.1 cytochrome P450 [Rhodophyticola sp. MJ-SS7]